MASRSEPALLGPEAESSRWILGRKYDEEEVEAWISHFRSIPWFTYRQGFRAMEPYPYTDDAGWGCMLALIRHTLGRDWRLPWDPDRARECKGLCDLLLWFADAPGPRYLFSIHNMVQVGMTYDKLPGEWYGPSTSAYVLRDLATVHRKFQSGGLRVLVTQAEVIYIDEVHKLCTGESEEGGDGAEGEQGHTVQNCVVATEEKSSRPPDDVQGRAGDDQTEGGGGAGGFFDPLLNRPPAMVEEEKRKAAGHGPWSKHGVVIIVPLRLGLASLNPAYIPGLLATFRMPQSLGFIGGKPNHAIYFVGSQETELFGLDPHYVQQAPQVMEASIESTVDADAWEEAAPYVPEDEHLRSVQCKTPQLMQAKDLDPSLALGFYCRNEADFDDFCRRVAALRRELEARSSPCPFSVEQAPPDYERNGKLVAMMATLDDDESDGTGDGDSHSDVEDEYVVISRTG